MPQGHGSLFTQLWPCAADHPTPPAANFPSIPTYHAMVILPPSIPLRTSSQPPTHPHTHPSKISSYCELGRGREHILQVFFIIKNKSLQIQQYKARLASSSRYIPAKPALWLRHWRGMTRCQGTGTWSTCHCSLSLWFTRLIR